MATSREPLGKPRVSILLLTLNQERYLHACLASIEFQIYREIEVIVLDDFSGDETRTLLEKWSATTGLSHELIFSSARQGINRILNIGLERASGEFIAVLSADDVLLANRFAEQVDVFEKVEEDVACIIGDVVVINEKGLTIGLLEAPSRFLQALGSSRSTALEMLENNWVPAPSALSRRDLLLKVGGYNEYLPFEDYDLWFRFLSAGYRFSHLPGPLTKYRVHARSFTGNPAMRKENIVGAAQVVAHWAPLIGGGTAIGVMRLLRMSVMALKRRQVVLSVSVLNAVLDLLFGAIKQRFHSWLRLT